ncbi:MAG: hypothetical protein ACE5ES_03760 [Candidatus Nanoarchaeia archaeon]
MREKIFLLFVIILFSMNFLSSHLEGGSDKVVEAYIIDFGFSPKNPTENVPINIAFNLVNETTKELIEPEKVWIRITNKENIVFSGTFHPEAEHILFKYTFPKKGNYEIKARFFENDKVITETSFSINIKQKTFLLEPTFIILIAFIIIILFRIIKTKK